MNANKIQAGDLEIAPLIHSIRGVRVILDTDLARLYEVPTKRLNEQLRRNSDRFPGDFAFQLTAEEWSGLRSRFAAGSNLKSQIATSSFSHGGRRTPPWAFTEHGALQAANVQKLRPLLEPPPAPAPTADRLPRQREAPPYRYRKTANKR
jgi:hypothetical protein